MWLVLAIVVLVAVIADGIASGLSLQLFFDADNLLTQTFVFGAGFVITGIVSFTTRIFSPGSPFLLKILWLMAILIDAYTTFIVVAFYLILRNPYSVAPDISTIKYDPNNWPATLLAYSLPIILSGTTMLAHYVVENLE